MPEVVVEGTAETCFNMARVYLNDVNIQLWSDEVLLPMMKVAHLELQQKLKSRASPVMKAWAGLQVNAYDAYLLDQPPDLTSPIKIWERPFGATGDFAPMTETDVLPFLYPQTPNLIWWMWIENLINFVGATVITEIVLLYWKRLPIPTLPTDPIGIIDGEQYLGPRIAAIAAASVGEEATSSACAALAEAQLQIVLSGNRSRAGQQIGISSHP